MAAGTSPVRAARAVTLIAAIFLAALCQFHAAPAAAADALLRWTNRAPLANGYRLYIGSSSGQYTQRRELGTLATDSIDGLVHYHLTNLADAEIYALAVSAYNGAGESALSNEKLLSLDGRNIPIANAGADQTVAVGDRVDLGANVEPALYVWFQRDGPPVSLSARTLARVSFVPAVAGRYVFEVVAANVLGGATVDTVVVTVGGAPPALTATRTPTPVRSLTPTPTRTPTTAASASTRLYLTGEAPSLLPATTRGSWLLPPMTFAALSPTKGGPATNILRVESFASTADVGLVSAVSESIDTIARAPGASFNWGIEVAEQAADANLFFHFHVYVLEAGSERVRCTWLSNYREPTSLTAEWETTPVGRVPKSGMPSLSACTPLRGDRLAMEIGFVARNSIGDTRWGFLNYGGTAGDVRDGVGGGAPWVELRGVSLTFKSPNPTPVATATRTPARTPTRTATLAATRTATRRPTLTPTPTATPASAQPVRLYLNATPPDFVPPQTRGGWQRAPSTLARLALMPSGSASNSLRTETSATVADTGLLWAISPPFESVSFRAGAPVTWAIEAAQQSSDTDAFWHLHLYVVAPSGSVRCTLLSNYRESAGQGEEWSTTPKARGPKPSAPNLASCTGARAGDRLAAELGFVARNTTSSPRYSYISYGGTGADAVTGSPGGAAWIELTGAQLRFSAP